MILYHERRRLGHCYAGIILLSAPPTTVVAVLQHHAGGPHRWQGRIYPSLAAMNRPVWESPTRDYALEALDDLFNQLATILPLPDDLYAWANDLLPL